MYIPISVCMYVSMCVCMYAGKNVCMKYNTIFKTVTASCMHAWEMVLCCPLNPLPKSEHVCLQQTSQPPSFAKGGAYMPSTDSPVLLLQKILRLTIKFAH